MSLLKDLLFDPVPLKVAQSRGNFKPIFFKSMKLQKRTVSLDLRVYQPDNMAKLQNDPPLPATRY